MKCTSRTLVPFYSRIRSRLVCSGGADCGRRGRDGQAAQLADSVDRDRRRPAGTEVSYLPSSVAGQHMTKILFRSWRVTFNYLVDCDRSYLRRKY